eukprot:TRINITY_DN1092_c0_g3_i2.p2 TRINITY_DN1092_c0_g3~~TRINITY_DN1092_c0_g3_i2.p2  ORF type:complete len:139 (-),score=51.21 TRINITY_DN1092_c0_g3_i2:726-1142(-)
MSLVDVGDDDGDGVVVKQELPGLMSPELQEELRRGDATTPVPSKRAAVAVLAVDDSDSYGEDESDPPSSLAFGGPCGFLGLIPEEQKDRFQATYTTKRELKQMNDKKERRDDDDEDFYYEEWEYCFCLHSMKKISKKQ